MDARPEKKPDAAMDDLPDAEMWALLNAEMDALDDEELYALLDRLEAFAARPDVDEQHRRDLMSVARWFWRLSLLAELEIRRLSRVAALGEMAAKVRSAADTLEMRVLKYELKYGPAKDARTARAEKHPEWARINAIIDQGLKLNSKPKQIEKMLADEGYTLGGPSLRQQIGRRKKKKKLKLKG
jgi:hypothetical protein